MALRTLLKFRNLDSTRDLNDRNVGLVSAGIISGAEVVAVPGQLAVDVSPYKLISIDGMVVEETSVTQRFSVLSGQITVIAIKAKYRENNSPIIEMVAYPIAAFLALPEYNYYLVCAYVSVPSGQTQVLQSYISFNPPASAPPSARPRDVVDSQSRQSFRGVLSNSGLLPLVNNRLGDYYFVQDIARGVVNFYGWDGSFWRNMTDAATLSVDLISHRANLFPNEKHLTDDEKNAVVGTSGVPVSGSNKLVDNADTRVPTQNQTNALQGNPANPSASNKFVTELFNIASPQEYTAVGPQATLYVLLPYVSGGNYYGPFYVGNTSNAAAIEYFKLYSSSLNREYTNLDGSAVEISAIYKSISPLILLDPSVDADSDGYYAGPLYLMSSATLDSDCTIRFGQKSLFKESPALGDGIKFPKDMLLRSPPTDAQISSDVIEKVQAVKGTLWDVAVPSNETNRALRRSVLEGAEWSSSNFKADTVVGDLKNLPLNSEFYTLFENIYWSRTSNVVTVTSAAHGLSTGCVINIISSGGGAFAVTAGTKKITVANSNQFYFSDTGSNGSDTLVYSVSDFLENAGVEYVYTFSNDTGTNTQYSYSYVYNNSMNTGAVTFSGLPVGSLSGVQVGNIFIDGSGSEYSVILVAAPSIYITKRTGDVPTSIDTSLGGLSGYVRNDQNPRSINLADLRALAGTERILFNRIKPVPAETNPFTRESAFEIEYPLLQRNETRIRFYGGFVNDHISSIESAVKVVDESKIACTAIASNIDLMYRSVTPLSVITGVTFSAISTTVTVTVPAGHGFVSSDALNVIIKVTVASSSIFIQNFVVTEVPNATQFRFIQVGLSGNPSGTLSYYTPQQAKMTFDGLIKTAATISASDDFLDLSNGGYVASNILDALQVRIDRMSLPNLLTAGKPHTVEFKFPRFYQFRVYGLEISQPSISAASINSGRAFVNQKLFKLNSKSAVTLAAVGSQKRGLISAQYIDYDRSLSSLTYEMSDFDGISSPPQGPVVSGSTDITLVSGVSNLNAYYRSGDVVKVRTQDVITSEQYEEVKVIDSFPSTGVVRFTMPFIGGTASANVPLYHLGSTQYGSSDPAKEFVRIAATQLGTGYVSTSLCDFSTVKTTTLKNRYFSSESGTIQLTAYQSKYNQSDGIDYLSIDASSSSTLRIVFIGTRLDLIAGPGGACSFTVNIDGSDPITFSVYGSAEERITIINNARYQSHEIFITPAVGNLLIKDFSFFAPDFKTKPQGCIISNNLALARNIPSQAVNGDRIPTGSLCVDSLACGGMFVNGTGIGSSWSLGTTSSPFYAYPVTSKVGSTFEYSFYGDGFEIDYLSHTNCGTGHLLYIDGSLASVANFPAITRWGLSSAGVVNMQSAALPASPTRKKFGISGLPIDYHRIRIDCFGNEMNVLHFYEIGATANVAQTAIESGARKIISGPCSVDDLRYLYVDEIKSHTNQITPIDSIFGISDGRDNPEGTLGESLTISPALSITPAASGVYKTVTALTLNPGKYMISAAVYVNKGTITVGASDFADVSLSAVTDSAGTGSYSKSRQSYPLQAFSSGMLHTGVLIIKLEIPTTIYLTSSMAYTSLGSATYTSSSYIDAIRVG